MTLDASNNNFPFAVLIIIIIFVVALAIIIPLLIVRRKYKNFVLRHNEGIRELAKLNNDFHFNVIEPFELTNSYDNEAFYDTISCQDYLTYELVYFKKQVNFLMKKAFDNKVMYQIYKKRIEERCSFDKYDTDELPKNIGLLREIEEKVYRELVLKPTTEFVIFVKLNLTNINGYLRHSKSAEFSEGIIKSIISSLNNKDGRFYRDYDIWQAICRVERGKVTNKLRFAIYERDGYRCRYCGRKTNDLEIDHIVPIAKGGKTTYDNLQTLCHRCNTRKGSNIY